MCCFDNLMRANKHYVSEMKNERTLCGVQNQHNTIRGMYNYAVLVLRGGGRWSYILMYTYNSMIFTCFNHLGRQLSYNDKLKCRILSLKMLKCIY